MGFFKASSPVQGDVTTKPCDFGNQKTKQILTDGCPINRRFEDLSATSYQSSHPNFYQLTNQICHIGGPIRIGVLPIKVFLCFSPITVYIRQTNGPMGQTNGPAVMEMENRSRDTKWVLNPKIMGKPPNHPFVHRVFHEINHYFHHPYLGYHYFWVDTQMRNPSTI